jgi:hypothetical protein
MIPILNRPKSLIFLGTATCVLTVLAGCGGGSRPATGPQAAKNIYMLNYASTNQDETDTVLTFPVASSGTATPSATLNLPSNFYAESVASGPGGNLYVGGYQGSDATTGEILIFAAGATGSATPTTTITGGISNNGTTFDFPYFITFNSKGQLFVQSDDYSIVAFAPDATGAATPTQYISWGQTNFNDIWGIAADAAGEVFIADYGNNAVYAFAAGATGNAAPVRTITGTDTAVFTEPYLLASDDAGDITVSNYNGNSNANIRPSQNPVRANLEVHRQRLTPPFLSAEARPNPHSELPGLATSVVTFPAGSNGNAKPSRVLSGSSTNIVDPEALTIDAVSNLYYVDYINSSYITMLFPATATGNVAPTTSFTSTAVTDSYGGSIAAY